MKHKYTFLFALPLCMGLACTPSPQEEGKDNLIGAVWYGTAEPGQRTAGLGPYLRLFLSGFYDRRI